jgi:hypothetical protein
VYQPCEANLGDPRFIETLDFFEAVSYFIGALAKSAVGRVCGVTICGKLKLHPDTLWQY